MYRIVVCVFTMIAFAGVATAAQDGTTVAPATQEQKAGQARPGAAPEGKPDTARPLIPSESPRGGMLANVRLEVTITDQRGAGQPTTKTVSLVLADRSPGRLRTSGDVRTPEGYRPIVLNVDARPEFTRDGRVKANVTLEYRPTVGEGKSEDQVLTTISESFEVILDDGKPLVVSQSADPYTDRRVRVEVKATILR